MIRKIVWVLVCINVIAFLLCTAFLLPDTVPVHYNFAGEADRWGSKWVYAFFGAIPLILCIVYEFYRRGREQKPNYKMEEKLVPVIALVFIPLMWILFPLKDDPTRLSAPFLCGLTGILGALFAFMGNYMGKIRHNRHLGLRVYWTLKNETVWNKTHRLQGFTAVIAGSLMILFSIIGAFSGETGYYWCFGGLLVGIVLAVLVPTVYSYVLYHKLQKEGKL